MKTMKSVGIVLLAVVVLVAVGGCKSKGSVERPRQDEAAKSLGIPKELTLDLGNKVSMKLVLIPAGKFMMGSPKTEKDRDENETQHEVTISKPFYMGTTHVTVDQFAAFVKDSSYKTDAEKDGWSVGPKISDGDLGAKKLDGASWRNPSYDQKGDHPVVHVSWNDAKAFCDWLSKKTGKTVVLPTEAQWEYACRAGTKTAYPWGDDPDDGKGWANCADRSLKKKLPNAPSLFFNWDDRFVFTSPVGSFKANAFGLYDMVGNVLQWCGDRPGEYGMGAATDPTGAGTRNLDFRVLRGGSWGSEPSSCRSASRNRHDPAYRYAEFGFRVAVLAAGAAEPSIQPATQPSTQPAEELTLDLGNKVSMKLVQIPAGKFMMGSPNDENDRNGFEGPQHEVTISKPFYMGAYEITQEQWTAVMGTTPWKGKDYAKDGATNAASYISWDDAADFCKKLSAKTGKTVSLPTEAQWEYACRAGSKTRLSYGDDDDYSKLGDYAWYIKNARDVGEKYAHAVGQKKVNDFGLYDMHGNVWEWCSDWYADSYANAGKADPSGPVSGTFRVLRGGSFDYDVRDCRSAARLLCVPALRWGGYGFRVVVAPGL